MKKLLKTFLGMALVAALVAGCSDSKDEKANAGESKKETIRLSYWNSEDTVKELLTYLESAIPEVDVEFQFIDNTNYSTIIDTQLAAGEGPDIISEAPDSALKHARLGYLEDITNLTKDYADAGKSVYSNEDKVYAVPGISWFEGIYYNKDLFAENKIELPKTYDEFIAISKQFEELDVKPLAAGLKSWEPMMKSSMAFVTADYLSTAEGENFNAQFREGKATLKGNWDSYLEKWSEMISKGIYSKDATGISHDEALNEFATGKAAMFASGPWDLEAIQAKNPDLNLGMFPFYGTKESEGWLIGGPGAGFAVNANSPNKELALKVVEAIASPEGQKALWENNKGGSTYLNGTSFDLPEVYEGVNEAITAGNVFAPWNEWGALGGVHQDFGVELQKLLLGEQDIPTTLENIDAVANELKEKLGN